MRVKLDLIIAGSCRHPACMVTGKAGLKNITFPSLVGRITHPTRGVILFDTGYGEALSKSKDLVARCYRRLLPYKLAPGEACIHQLAAAGISASEVKGIILSHLHPDHAGGLTDFPQAKIYLSRVAFDELARKNIFSRGRLGLIPDLFPHDLATRVKFVEDYSRVSLDRGWGVFDIGTDIFGDSSVLAVPLPGHAPGHFGIKLKISNDREVFLAADAAWLSCCYKQMLEPLLPARVFIHNYKAYYETLLKLHNLSIARPDIAIVPSHCSEAIRSLQHDLV
jgi:glyoxylase-like metal-dependent hydrolase (beta-lactamase superfamily II)